MNAAKQFFRKYLFSSMLILIMFLIANVIILLGILLITRNNFDNEVMPISQIADHINVDNQWNVSIQDEVTKLLSERSAWAMVLDNNGVVIWENSMPRDLPRQYTAPDIAKFSRWYLNEYPVLVQTLSAGLLVIGCPPNSITKLNYVTDSGSINTILCGGAFVVISNILLMLLLFWHNTRKVEKAVVPILYGIESIANGNLASISEKGVFAEINTELNRAGQYIIKKDKARADWINGVSHDARTPLSIMLGYAGEIEDNPVLPQTTREQAGIVRKQGEKLRRLIADLNLTSKLEYSMQPLNLGTIYPVELARQMISEFLNNGLEDKFTIDFDVASDANFFTFQGDESLLMRMLGNLIQNSISHNPDGCHIVVTVCKVGGSCKFVILDDGIGLLENQIDQFNAGTFSTQNYKENGETVHGFGLQLVHQIVDAHKGKIYFESNQPKGLIAILYFSI